VVGEAEGAQLRLKVPDHQAAVLRARDELLHVRVEGDAVDGILVPAERALQRRVLPHSAPVPRARAGLSAVFSLPFLLPTAAPLKNFGGLLKKSLFWPCQME